VKFFWKVLETSGGAEQQKQVTGDMTLETVMSWDPPCHSLCFLQHGQTASATHSHQRHRAWGQEPRTGPSDTRGRTRLSSRCSLRYWPQRCKHCSANQQKLSLKKTYNKNSLKQLFYFIYFFFKRARRLMTDWQNFIFLCKLYTKEEET
jgi:hypothetical protein